MHCRCGAMGSQITEKPVVVHRQIEHSGIQFRLMERSEKTMNQLKEGGSLEEHVGE